MTLKKKREFSSFCALSRLPKCSYSTILTAYWDQPAPSYFNGSEDTPEYERRKKVGFVIGPNVSFAYWPPLRFTTQIQSAPFCSRPILENACGKQRSHVGGHKLCRLSTWRRQILQSFSISCVRSLRRSDRYSINGCSSNYHWHLALYLAVLNIRNRN